MKKRNHARRRRGQAGQSLGLSSLIGRARRKRRPWTFERLEERCYFSTTPFSQLDEVVSYSSNTPEGLQQILLREMMWSALQSGSSDALSVQTLALPNDPYLQYQWHLINLGQSVGNPDYQEILATPGEDINVVGAWDLGYTGAGVVVAVVDSGVVLEHPDLAANIDTDLDFDAINDDDNASPNLQNFANAHGTAVAGLIGAVGNNGIGMTGAAYDATLVPIRLINLNPDGTATPITDGDIFEALTYQPQLVDIYNNSWGFDDPTNLRGTDGLTPQMALALRNGVFFGRGGLGSIFVFASGNAGAPNFLSIANSVWDSANYSGLTNSRYTIAVGGVDHDGKYNNIDGSITTYMEAGPSILVAAPTGSVSIQVGLDTGAGSGIWTTDALGDDGFNQVPLPNGNEIDNDFFPDTDYTSRFNGTSASAPLVSGVIALMFEANPNLSWRDVQDILVRSARQTDIEDPQLGGELGNDQSWVVNRRDFFRDPQSIGALPVAGGFNPFPLVYNPTPIVNAVLNPNNPIYLPPNPPNQPFPTGQIILPGVAYGDPDPDAMPPVAGLLLVEGYAPPYAPLYVNGAGYTVSAGRGAYGEEIGYGHGVVDAELAVQLARQWTIQNQTLPDELTFTTYLSPQGGRTIRAGQVGNDESGNILVPGGVTVSDEDFIAFWNEYFADDDPADPNDGPFSDYDGAFPGDRGGHYYFSVPDSNAMTVEWVEVSIDVSGTSNDLDYLRITLVSPDGTHSELNTYFQNGQTELSTSQTPIVSQLLVDPPGTIDPQGDDDFVWTFSTNRNWGERYDNQLVYNPIEVNPYTGGLVYTNAGTPFQDTGGFAVKRGWQLYFENYSETEFDLNSLEITWHGSPIAANTERIQGIVGVDAGSGGLGAGDGQFAFSNNTQKTEPGAANVTVVATRVSDGVEVAKFITGADGNFYFDLPPDEYVITVEDPLGRTALDEQNVPQNTLPLYQQEWHIDQNNFFQPTGTAENVVVPNLPLRPFGLLPYPDNSTSFFQNFRVDANANGVPVRYQDANGDVVAGPRYINFLLDPGPIPANEILVSGQVFADLDGDGVNNNDDAPAADFIVYADTNGTGQFEVSDPFTLTDQLGNYQLSIPTGVLAVFDVGAVAPTPNWTQTFPIAPNTLTPVLGGPGSSTTGVDFGFQPIIVEPPPVPKPGSILGVVFDDVNGNGVREAGDEGVSGFHVYADLDNSGGFNAGEPESITGSNGAYFLANVDPGFVTVRVDVASPWALTSPAIGYRTVNLPSEGIVYNVLFGVHNTATRDFGDLPNSFKTTLAVNGPRHDIIAGFHLGLKVDGEVNGQPSPGADGDDVVSGDEDGVVVLDMFGIPDPMKVLRSGLATDPDATTLRVTVAGVGGLLTGWIDFDQSGTFEAGEKLIWKNPEGFLVDEVDLNPGTYDLPITVPEGLPAGLLGARFRWGEAGLDYFGPSIIGEVEDYWFDPPAGPIPGTFPDGDYDFSGTVDDDDFTVWRSSYGAMGAGLPADGNGDGVVNGADYTVWRDNFGATSAASGGGGGSAVTSQSSMVVSSTTSGGPVVDRSQVVVDQLLAAGYQKKTIRVGLDGTRTVWYLPPTTAQASGGTETSVEVVSAALPTVQASPLSFARASVRSITSPGARPTTLLVDQAAGNVGADANVDLELLDRVLAESAPIMDDDDADDPLSFATDEPEDADVRELALAVALEDQDDWRLAI